ncbi:U4/U6 small nuclear ribonucleoprotein Prp3 [Phytophthora nicotianae]|uniref:U4/U6 small nuclear ribonucleoprotein Prp3 n=1 Tax=Phytophthora nicotianae TaxID=4792 RepID=A0A0W8CX78_PHYNI|nr:U4/U6 small nuclear ribonucleoprotein Prp3 [Phytophthora nicotianae]
MNGNVPMDVNGMGMMDYGMGAMPMMPGADPTSGFMDQLQDGNKAIIGLDGATFDLDLAGKSQNRNRGNYRCSKGVVEFHKTIVGYTTPPNSS